jgi:hypothetical protein
MPAGRPPKDPALVAEALRLIDGGMSPQEAADAMKGRISYRTIYRAQEARRKAAPVSRPSKRAPPVTHAPIAPPTENDRKVDELIATSRTWRRVCEALGRFARRHPSVAADLSSELRGLNL